MAEAPCGSDQAEALVFNDPQSSDLSLTLQSEERAHKSAKTGATTTAGTPEAVTLFLHSKVLQKHSAFFERLLAERWSAGEDMQNKEDSQRQVTLKDCSNIKAYARALELLYETSVNGHARILKGSPFTNVQEAVEVFQVADRLQITCLQKYALEYILAVPWTTEERDFVQSLSQYEMCVKEPLLQERLAPARLSDAFRQKLLMAMLKSGGQVDLRASLMRLLEKGAFGCTTLEKSIKSSYESLRFELARYSSSTAGLKELLKRLWLLTDFAFESAADIASVVKALENITNVFSGNSFAVDVKHDEYVRSAYLQYFYQDLISTVRRGRRPLTFEDRTNVLRLYV